MAPARDALLICVSCAAVAASPAPSLALSHTAITLQSASEIRLGPFTLDGEGDADAAVALSGEDDDARRVLDIALRGRAEAFTDTGLRYGAQVELGVRRDPGREGLSRAVAGLAGPGGAVSGLPADPARLDDMRAGVETASVFVKGPWGEVRAGRGEGAAALEAAALPGAFRVMRADDARADLSGLAVARTRDTLSGRAAKLTVRSARLFGVRASASYTPDADDCSLDSCPDGAVSAEGVVEAGLSFDHASRDAGRWSVSLGAALGEADPAPGLPVGRAEDPHALSARLAWRRGDLSLGAGWLRSNDGFDDGRYEAWSASAALERGDWLFAAEASRAEIEPVSIEVRAVQLGASRLLPGGAVAGIGWTRLEEDTPGGSQETSFLFLEAGLRF